MIKFSKAHETPLNKTTYQLHSILSYQKTFIFLTFFYVCQFANGLVFESEKWFHG